MRWSPARGKAAGRLLFAFEDFNHIVVIAYTGGDDRRFRQEVGGLIIAGAMPVVGVLLFDWDRYAVMFIVSWEVMTTSAVLAWLFNYPDRSTLAATLLALTFAPTGLLMWVVLADDYEGARFGGMVRELSGQTWIAMMLTAVYAGLACRGAMLEARKRGTSIEENNRILIMWLASVYLPFVVFTLVMAAGSSMGTWSLAAVLLVKTAVEVMSLGRKRQRR